MGRKRKEYTEARELLTNVFGNGLDSKDKSEEIKEKIMEFARENYQEDFEKDKITLSLWTKTTSNIKWKVGEDFVKVFFNEISYIEEVYGLDRKSKSLLYSLQEFLMYETNLLIDKKGIPLTRAMLAEALDVRPETISKSMKGLVDLKIIMPIRQGKNVHYLMNPHIMFKGSDIDKKIIKLFEYAGYISRQQYNYNKQNNNTVLSQDTQDVSN